MVRGLRPEDPPDWMRDALEGESGEIMLAGHMPNIASLAVMLGAAAATPLHGMVTLERVAPRQYNERGRLQAPAAVE
jgi:hypothetical protein